MSLRIDELIELVVPPHKVDVFVLVDVDENKSKRITTETLFKYAEAIAQTKPIVAKTMDHVVGEDEYTIVLDGASNTVTSTLPTAVGISGRILNLKCIDDTYAITVDAHGSETIDDELTQTLGKWDNMKIQAYSGGWLII